MLKAPAYMAVAVAFVGRCALAQMPGMAGLPFVGQDGLRLYEVSLYTSYVSSAYPLATTTTISPNAAKLGHDLSYGGMASAGWRYQRDRARMAVSYTGSYNQSENFSSLSAFGHSLTVNGSWDLTPKWTVNLSGSGQYETLAQYVFQPTALSTIAQTPATFDNLAAAMSAGQYSDAQAAAALTGAGASAFASPLQSPASSLLLGVRVLTYASQLSLNYALTPRLSFHISGMTAAGSDRVGNSGGVPQNYAMPSTIGITAGASMNYELSTRTEIGLQLDEARMSNRYQDAYTTNASASLGRKMGSHWFLRASGGAAHTKTVQQAYGAPIANQIIGSGGLGYQLQAHTMLATYNRTTSDINGFAVGTMANFAGTWNWRRPGAGWGLVVSAGQQDLNNTGFASLSGWQISAGSTVHLAGNVVLVMQYAYARDTGTYLGNVTKLSVSSIRLSLAWAPQWQATVGAAPRIGAGGAAGPER